MALLTRLEDSEEGLIGITEEGERVHLGVPVASSCIRNLRARGKKPHEDVKEFEQSIRIDDSAYWFFDPESVNCACPVSVENHVKYTYIRFEKKKEEAFTIKQKRYLEGPSHKQRVVKIHRTQGEGGQ